VKRKFGIQPKNGPPPVGKVFIITLIVFFLVIFVSLELIERGLRPTLIEIANQRANQVATWAINEGVNKEMANDLTPGELIDVQKDNEGNIATLGWNSVTINTFLRNANFRIQNYLKRVENGEITPENALDLNVDSDSGPSLDTLSEHPAYYEIPLGQALNNALLANLGPKIPVHFEIMGTVESNPMMTHEAYGINSTWVHYYIEFIVKVRIVVPFTTDEVTVKQNVTIDTRVVHGEVPEFYGGGSGKGPDVSVPLESFE
jgi:sporulation protein YunB